MSGRLTSAFWWTTSTRNSNGFPPPAFVSTARRWRLSATESWWAARSTCSIRTESRANWISSLNSKANMKQKSKPIALVTGAASGIGKATTERLLRDGARVIALDRSAEALAKLAAAQKPRTPLWTTEFDLANTAGILNMINQ